MPRTRKLHDLTDEQLQTTLEYYRRRVATTTSEDRKLRAARAVRDYEAETVRRRLAESAKTGEEMPNAHGRDNSEVKPCE